MPDVLHNPDNKLHDSHIKVLNFEKRKRLPDFHVRQPLGIASF